jgi:hypothetical protein
MLPLCHFQNLLRPGAAKTRCWERETNVSPGDEEQGGYGSVA